MLNRLINNIVSRVNKHNDDNTESIKLMLGRTLVPQAQNARSLREAEFQAFSQWGDDGIIQYLIHHVDISNEIFVEFGVENYTEANTRFLLQNNNWRGLIMDGSKEHMKHVRNESIHWRFDLTAIPVFITAENINKTIEEAGISGEIGLLSVDIDGNDYWVWKAIDVIQPDIVIAEYNSVFGAKHAITIPYQPDFYRTDAHYSNLYWGCSAKALCQLGDEKGYHFVGCNAAGNNCYFVRKDKIGSIPVFSPEEGYVESKFRESRDEQYNLSLLRGSSRLDMILDCEVYDLNSKAVVKIRDLDNN